MPLLWPVCRLWLARSRSFLLPPPCSVRWHCPAPLAGTLLLTSPPAGTLLLLNRWHLTAIHPLVPYRYSPAGTLLLLFRSVDPSSVTPSRGIALPPWLLSNALDRCNDLPDGTSWFRWALYWSFHMSPINNPLPARRVSVRQSLFFCFGEPAEGFGSLYLYVSMYCFLTWLRFYLR